MNKPTMTNAVFGTVVMTGLLVLGGAAAPASADSPEAVANCDSHSVTPPGSETLAAQPAAGGNPAVVVTQSFATSQTVTWIDPESGLSYLVVIDEAGTGSDRPLPEATPPLSGPNVVCVTTPAPAATPTLTAPAIPAELTVPATVAPPATPTPAATPPAATPAATPALNPTVTPAATSEVAPALTPTADSRMLAETGTDGAPVLAAGLLTVMAGAGVLLLVRRLGRTEH